MAYWGMAMTYYHPLWEAPGPAALKEGSAAVGKAGGKTSREQDYLAALQIFYKDFDKLDHRTRAVACEKMMEQLQARDPDDPEPPSSTLFLSGRTGRTRKFEPSPDNYG
jgi:hypothetical protein